MKTSKLLDSGGKCADLKDSYVIFITENDTEKMGWSLYYVERMIQSMDRSFDDGSHIVYVNGEYKGDDPVGRLVHDFNCMDVDEMYYDSLAKRVRYFKKDKGGQKNMSSCLDEWLEAERKEIAANFWNCGVKDIAIIAEATHLSEETVREAVGEQTATTA